MSSGARKGYGWPASDLTCAEMEVLVDMRVVSNKPITVLLKEAVQVAYRGTWSLVTEVKKCDSRL